MTRKEQIDQWVEELRQQDIELQKIFNRRKELFRISLEANLYDETWEALYADGESHYTF